MNITTPIRRILVAVAIVVLLGKCGYAEVKNVRQRFVVRVPGTVTMTESHPLSSLKERRIRIQASADVTVSIQAEVSAQSTAIPPESSFTLLSGEASLLRVTTSDRNTIERLTPASYGQHFSVPDNQRAVLTVSGL